MFNAKPKQALSKQSQTTTKYLTDRQVSIMTGIGLQTLRNHRFLGKGIPYIKLDKSVRYLEGDVIAYMESHRVVPGGDEGNGGVT